MSDVMGIIYTSKDDFKLRELTAYRAVAALPVAGRYRIIDFTLSNLVNSGVRNVGVIAQRNYHSLMVISVPARNGICTRATTVCLPSAISDQR